MKLSTRRNQAALTLIKQAYEYSAKFAQVSNRQAIFDLRTALESRGVLEEFEMALLVNLMPRSPDEAKVHRIRRRAFVFVVVCVYGCLTYFTNVC